jgi:GT2 family glycosyltransferase
MTRPSITIVVTPRERFSFGLRSLEALFARTNDWFELVYVDAGSPPLIERQLARQARVRDFRLLRFDHYLSPNAARNVGAAEARTPYIVFLENDMLVSPAWLERLKRCAEEHEAAAVGPLYCRGLPEAATIHSAGGVASIDEEAERRLRVEWHFTGMYTRAASPSLRPTETELLHFDCLLVRRDVWQTLGPLDESLLSTWHDLDFCLRLREAGNRLMVEPSATATYVGPLPLKRCDREFFSLRWCDAWNRQSVEHFQRKWSLSESEPMVATELARLDEHRRSLWQPIRQLLRPLGRRRMRKLEQQFIAPLELRLNRRWFPGSDEQRRDAA